MRSSRASHLFAAALAGAACSSAQGPLAIEPLAHEVAPRAALPDPSERQAARLVELVLAERADEAQIAALRLHQLERERLERGLSATGLAENGSELLAALGGELAYTRYAERTLDEGTHDPLLERRLATHLDSRPLARAEQHERAQLRNEISRVVNRVSAPLSQLALGGVVAPIATGRAALATLLVARDLPDLTTRERQALRAYEEFLTRYPDAPEAPEVAERTASYRARLARDRHEDALGFAERALRAGAPFAAIAHLERAERVGPGVSAGEREREQALARQARSALGRYDSALRATHATDGTSLDANARAAEAFLARGLLLGTRAQASARAEALVVPARLEDERAFIAALGDHPERHDAFLAALEPIAVQSGQQRRMARHARWLLASPEQNPYRAFRAARQADRSARVRWLAAGRYANGRTRRNLPRPLEWLLDAPGFAVSIVTFPQRLLQYPSARARFGGNVLRAGERYLLRFPDGAHSAEVREELEARYAQLGYWPGALRHHLARAETDPETVAYYRERSAERALLSADRQARIDVRMAIYTSVAREFADTPQAAEALAALRDLVESGTPQGIRVSREFLEEHPALWRPEALGLRPELFDGDAANGELASEGVTLVGQSAVELTLEDRDPLLRRIPEPNFARFVSLLEEVSYEQLVSDSRERPAPDPQRDLFFERARLGLLDTPDMRPAASSQAVYLGSSEKHGLVRRPESLLPVEFVVQGGLETYGLVAFPRVKPVPETPDAFLYR